MKKEKIKTQEDFSKELEKFRAFGDMLINTVKEEKGIYNSEEIHNCHDKGYKYLLSIKNNFIEFVKTFMKVNLEVELTEDNITLLDKEFITKEFGKQESDIIYEVKTENKVMYFVLLELQHKVDRKMAYRILNYMVEIWRKWEKSRNTKEKFTLPKIIPCVLYNGEKKWTAPIELKGLYEEIGEEEEYLVNFKYILIDIFRYKPEDLLNIGNIISSAFYLDTANKENMEKRLNELSESLRYMDSNELRTFMMWMSKMFVIDEKKEAEMEEKIFNWGEEDMGNLAKIGREIYNDGLAKERSEGEERGKEIGILEGEKRGKIMGINEGKIMGIKEGKIIGINEGKIIGINEGRVMSIKRLLSYKLNLDLEFMEKINDLPASKLEELERKIFEITSWEEVEEIIEE